MGVGTIVAGVLIAFLIIVIVGGIAFYAIMGGFEDRSNFKREHVILGNITISNKMFLAEVEYYRSNGCDPDPGYDYRKYVCSTEIAPFDYKLS
jgi:hypothetical protein